MISPVLGAIADVGGPRKPWLLAFMLLSSAATAVPVVRGTRARLSAAGADPGAGRQCLQRDRARPSTTRCCPTSPSHDQLGRWSGWGWGLGYIAGIVALALILVVFVQPKPPLFGLNAEEAEQVRITGPLLAVWFILFSLPLFLITPDRPTPRAPVRARACGTACTMLVATLKDVRAQRQHRPLPAGAADLQ